MNKRKIQAVINRIKDDILQSKKEIIRINDEIFEDNDRNQRIQFIRGQVYEATYIIRLLKRLKESIK
tara:strand:+ start:494 stop:694 length:201 start_codon:yes stop_codon:yes gene_type:complete